MSSISLAALKPATHRSHVARLIPCGLGGRSHSSGSVYSLMTECDLFGTIRLVRNWGRIGANRQERVEVYATEVEAGQALEAIAAAVRILRSVIPPRL